MTIYKGSNGRNMKSKCSNAVSGLALVISIIALTMSYTLSQRIAKATTASETGLSAVSDDTSHESFLQDQVLCNSGFASVFVRYRDSIDHLITVRLEIPPEAENSTPVTCDDREFYLNGVKLSAMQLAESAQETRLRAISHLQPTSRSGGIPVIDMTSLSPDQLDLLKRAWTN